jgi:hypothetical protein
MARRIYPVGSGTASRISAVSFWLDAWGVAGTRRPVRGCLEPRMFVLQGEFQTLMHDESPRH